VPGTASSTPHDRKEDAIPELAEEVIHEAMKADIEVEVPACNFEVGDNVVYPHHGAGVVVKKETKDLLGESRDYLTIQILHNSLTAMIPCENAHTAGLRRVIDGEQVKKVIGVLADEASEMPQSWTRRFKHNREKIKTGDVYELAEVVRNLAIRESQQRHPAGEKQMNTRANKHLATEFMYAHDKDEDGAESYLDELLQERFGARPTT
jgi:CarD family transcriptional regulator